MAALAKKTLHEAEPKAMVSPVYLYRDGGNKCNTILVLAKLVEVSHFS